MSSIRTVLVVALVACVPLCRAEEPREYTAPKPDDVTRLEKEVAKLREQVERLTQERDAAREAAKMSRRQVLQMTQELAQRPIQLEPPRLGPYVPQAGQVPGNWSPRQFNGMTFYVIPIGERSASNQALGEAIGK